MERALVLTRDAGLSPVGEPTNIIADQCVKIGDIKDIVFDYQIFDIG